MSQVDSHCKVVENRLLLKRVLDTHTHTHDAGLLFSLSKVSLSFHSRPRAGWDCGARGLTDAVRMRRSPSSAPASARITSHVELSADNHSS